MKIKPVKGRPMLHWVGKRPIDTVNAHPAQLVDTYNVDNPKKEPTYDKFKDGPNLLFHEQKIGANIRYLERIINS